jgi:hypothetical protein
MADSQHIERPAAVTAAKRNSYLRYVQIHMELLQDALTGQDYGCGVAQRDLEAIDKHLLEIWRIVCAARVEVVDPRPAPSGDAASTAKSAKVIPFRARLAG